MKLHEQIKARRTALGLTQRQLAEHIGTSQGRVGDWERGEVSPSLELIEKLAEHLGSFTIGGPSSISVGPSGIAWIRLNPDNMINIDRIRSLEVVELFNTTGISYGLMSDAGMVTRGTREEVEAAIHAITGASK